MGKTLRHLDLFSGPGGICTGFKSAGITTVCAVEKVASCVETYKSNHPNVSVIHKNIRDVSQSDLKKFKTPQIDIITSGMPCETFSTAGSSSRSFYDSRQNLYYETIRIASYLRPKLILFENVIGIQSKKLEKGGSKLVVDQIKEDLDEVGYSNQISIVLNSTDFGVPQSRKRYFLLASRLKSLRLSYPEATHTDLITVKDAFAGLPLNRPNTQDNYGDYTDIESSYSLCLKDRKFWNSEGLDVGNKPTYHRAPNHRQNTIERFKLINAGENLRDAFLKHSPCELENLQSRKVLPKKWFIQRNMRLIDDRPSKTITSHCLDELIHPVLNRALTVREVARLQSFPDNYEFMGGPYICPHIYETQDKYEQIGDAVPPLLARAWGLKVRELLNT